MRVVNELLQRPKVQAAVGEREPAAHKQLLAVLKGGNSNVSTAERDVTLNLKAILQQTEQNIGVGGRIGEKLPADAAQLTILRSDQLSTAQDVANAVRPLAIGLTALALILFALAIYLARGWRREALRATGFALLLAGVAALVARSIVGHAVTESLTTTESTKQAVENAWGIGTSLLDQAAVAAVAYGLVILFASWLAGPDRMATSTRAALAPYLRDPSYAWAGMTLIVLLLLIWGPTPATRQAFTALHPGRASDPRRGDAAPADRARVPGRESRGRVRATPRAAVRAGRAYARTGQELRHGGRGAERRPSMGERADRRRPGCLPARGP